MDDLISRAAAIERAIDAVDEWDGGWNPNREEYIRKYFAEMPAVDAAPIIRCASCKWWDGSTLGTAHRCAALHIATTGEFYCATAERKCNAFADQSGAEYVDNPTV
jgi:hypothetical protein